MLSVPHQSSSKRALAPVRSDGPPCVCGDVIDASAGLGHCLVEAGRHHGSQRERVVRVPTPGAAGEVGLQGSSAGEV